MDRPRRIGLEHLQPADVLFVTGPGAFAAFIRSVTGAEISHAMLALGPGLVMEATGDGVQERRIVDALREATVAIAMRRVAIDAAQRAAVCAHARSFAGRPYDYVGVNAAGVHSSRSIAAGVCLAMPSACVAFELNATDAFKDTRMFCSELVCRAYELAGIPLVDRSPSFANPAEVYRSHRLAYLGHLPVMAPTNA